MRNGEMPSQQKFKMYLKNGYKGKGAFIMKNTKRARRAAAFAAAVVMAACAAVPMSSSFSASAEGSISISNTATGHTTTMQSITVNPGSVKLSYGPGNQHYNDQAGYNQGFVIRSFELLI